MRTVIIDLHSSGPVRVGRRVNNLEATFGSASGAVDICVFDPSPVEQATAPLQHPIDYIGSWKPGAAPNCFTRANLVWAVVRGIAIVRVFESEWNHICKF